jgi:hypothetical protein
MGYLERASTAPVAAAVVIAVAAAAAAVAIAVAVAVAIEVVVSLYNTMLVSGFCFSYAVSRL